MTDDHDPSIPGRAETLKVLRLLGDYAPILMLGGDEDGYGARWMIDGQPVEPAIATYLLRAGHVADAGKTELGARRLALTESGARFREQGLRWWDGLSRFQKLRIILGG